jgi:hypothetical protein
MKAGKYYGIHLIFLATILIITNDSWREKSAGAKTGMSGDETISVLPGNPYSEVPL